MPFCVSVLERGSIASAMPSPLPRRFRRQGLLQVEPAQKQRTRSQTGICSSWSSSLRPLTSPSSGRSWADSEPSCGRRLPTKCGIDSEAGGVVPSLSAEQLAILMLALSNGLAIEQIVQPRGVDPDLFGRAVELIAVGLLQVATEANETP